MLEKIIKALKIAILSFILIFEIYYMNSYYNKYSTNDKEVQSNGAFLLNINEAITVEMSKKIRSKLESLRREKKLKSLLIVLDTPGGSPVASENLYSYFKTLQKDIKIYMYINSSAASGGYYIAVSNPKIYANKNALVGSIGVIMQNISFAKLGNELGIEDESLSAGEYKYLLSPLKNMDEKTKAYVKEYLLEPMYKNFSDTVALERDIKEEDRTKYFEGKIFVAADDKIKDVLVDEIISLPEIIGKVKKEQNTDTIKIVELKDKLDSFFSKILTSISTQSQKKLSISFN